MGLWGYFPLIDGTKYWGSKARRNLWRYLGFTPFWLKPCPSRYYQSAKRHSSMCILFSTILLQFSAYTTMCNYAGSCGQRSLLFNVSLEYQMYRTLVHRSSAWVLRIRLISFWYAEDNMNTPRWFHPNIVYTKWYHSDINCPSWPPAYAHMILISESYGRVTWVSIALSHMWSVNVSLWIANGGP